MSFTSIKPINQAFSIYWIFNVKIKERAGNYPATVAMPVLYCRQIANLLQ